MNESLTKKIKKNKGFFFYIYIYFLIVLDFLICNNNSFLCQKTINIVLE